jgi:hypothetical protein
MYTEPPGKWPLEILRRIWKDNIKMNLMDVGYENRKWMSPESVQRVRVTTNRFKSLSLPPKH